MNGQIRTWDKREDSTEEPSFMPYEDVFVVRLDDVPVSTVDRLELILQLRDLQER